MVMTDDPLELTALHRGDSYILAEQELPKA